MPSRSRKSASPNQKKEYGTPIREPKARPKSEQPRRPKPGDKDPNYKPKKQKAAKQKPAEKKRVEFQSKPNSMGDKPKNYTSGLESRKYMDELVGNKKKDD